MQTLLLFLTELPTHRQNWNLIINTMNLKKGIELKTSRNLQKWNCPTNITAISTVFWSGVTPTGFSRTLYTDIYTVCWKKSTHIIKSDIPLRSSLTSHCKRIDNERINAYTQSLKRTILKRINDTLINDKRQTDKQINVNPLNAHF